MVEFVVVVIVVVSAVAAVVAGGAGVGCWQDTGGTLMGYWWPCRMRVELCNSDVPCLLGKRSLSFGKSNLLPNTGTKELCFL